MPASWYGESFSIISSDVQINKLSANSSTLCFLGKTLIMPLLSMPGPVKTLSNLE